MPDPSVHRISGFTASCSMSSLYLQSDCSLYVQSFVSFILAIDRQGIRYRIRDLATRLQVLILSFDAFQFFGSDLSLAFGLCGIRCATACTVFAAVFCTRAALSRCGRCPSPCFGSKLPIRRSRCSCCCFSKTGLNRHCCSFHWRKCLLPPSGALLASQ